MALTAHPPKSRQLLARGQKFTLEYKFSHLALVWTENSQIYVTKLPNRQFDEKDLNELEGTLIPKEIVYPLWRVIMGSKMARKYYKKKIVQGLADPRVLRD